jgi:hypothetical protein
MEKNPFFMGLKDHVDDAGHVVLKIPTELWQMHTF